MLTSPEGRSLGRPLDREAIVRLVPHQGRMCLLDRALAWDAKRILCETDSHRAPDHPLRRDGMLPVICGLELALQAMALHGALISGEGQAPSAGFVSSLREVTFATGRLDTVAGPLRVMAVALLAETRGVIYRFRISGAAALLLRGQAMVMLPEGGR